MRPWVIVALWICAVRARLSGPAHRRCAQIDGDVAERGALGRGLDDERRLARLSRGFRDARDRIVDPGGREIDFDLGARAAQRRLELDRKRSGQPRAEIHPALRAPGGVQGESHSGRALVPCPAVDFDMGRGAEERAVADDLHRFAVALERSRRGLELFIGEELLDLKLLERSARVELRVVGTRGLAKLEVKGEIAFRLPLDGRRIDRQSSLAAQRLAHQEIGQRVGGSGHVGVRRRVDDRAGRRYRRC